MISKFTNKYICFYNHLISDALQTKDNYFRGRGIEKVKSHWSKTTFHDCEFVGIRSNKGKESISGDIHKYPKQIFMLSVVIYSTCQTLNTVKFVYIINSGDTNDTSLKYETDSQATDCVQSILRQDSIS